MFASHDDDEITFYEELGLAPNASPEEIRNAFRLLVRLLHPDQQTDPSLREIAEKQMRKLNRIYAVLSDPASRRSYDEVMGGGAPPIILNSPSLGLSRLGGRLAWAAAIVLSAGLLVWLASDNTPGAQSRSSDLNETPVTTSPSASVPAFPVKPVSKRVSEASQIAQLRSDLSAVIVERDTALRELNELRGTPEIQARQLSQPGNSWPPEGTEPRPPLTLTELPAAPKLPVIANTVLPRIERPANRQVVGFWFYAKPPEGQTNKNQALYPPEYIEATITEEGDVIHGRYRSRYRIADSTISPDVNFTFTGTPNGSQCNCQWTGAGAARGELTLKLTSENSMRIDWTASELGSQQGLSSGTAVLTRRIE